MTPESERRSASVDSPATSWPSASSEWFKEAFKDDYRLLYAGRTIREARLEVERIAAELRISPRDRVLDLCCGHGRHLEAFRGLGISATGVDLSMALLAAHRRERTDPGSGAPPEGRPALVRADMRALPFAACFDVVGNFFTSFGYFEAEADHAVAARELAGALRPSGRFSMDLMNPEVAIRTLKPRSERRVGSFDVVERRRYDPLTRRIEKETRLRYRPEEGRSAERRPEGRAGERRPGDRARTYRESVRVFSREEITALLRGAGLEVDRVLGDFSGAPYGADSPRLIVLGRKPAS